MNVLNAQLIDSVLLELNAINAQHLLQLTLSKKVVN